MSPVVLHGMLECLQNSYTHEYPLRNRCNIEKFRMLGRIKCGQVFDLLSTQFVPPRSTIDGSSFFFLFLSFYIYIFFSFNCFNPRSNVQGANFEGKSSCWSPTNSLFSIVSTYRIAASKAARNFYSTLSRDV